MAEVGQHDRAALAQRIKQALDCTISIQRRSFLQAGAGLLGAHLCLPAVRRAAAEPAPSKPVPINGAYSAPGLAYAALYVANGKKLWAEQGLQPNLRHVQGGALALVTLTNGDSDFVCVAASDAILAWGRGLKVQVVAAFYHTLPLQLTARRQWLEKVGLSKEASIEQKVRALKGVQIGTASVGGGPAQYTRFLGGLYGLDPERDIRITPVGQGPARIAALREERVNLVVGNPPEADQMELAGFGELYINFADIAFFKEFPFTVVVIKEEFAVKEPDRVRRLALAIGRANDILRNDIQGSVALLQEQFPNIDPEAIRRAMTRDRNAVAPSGRMTELMWANGYKSASAMKTIKHLPPLKEGPFWTNKFL